MSYFYPFDHTFLVNISSLKDSKVDAYEFSKVLWSTMIETRRLFQPDYKCEYTWHDLPKFFENKLE